MRISDWSSDVCSSDLRRAAAYVSHVKPIKTVELPALYRALAPRNARLIFQKRLHRVVDAPHLCKALFVTGRCSIVAVVKQPMQTLQSPGSNGSAFLCNQDLGQVLNLVFFPDRVIEVEHQPATDEAPRRIAGDRQIVRCEPVGAFWGENEPVLTLELGHDWLTLNYLFEDAAGRSEVHTSELQ